MLTLCNGIFAMIMACFMTNEDEPLLAILRSADAEHSTRCASGRMSISLRTEFPDTPNFIEMNGHVEWDEDYLFFDGFYKDRQGDKGDGGRPVLLADYRYRFVRSGGKSMGWTQRLGDWTQRYSSENWVVFFPSTRFRDSRVERLTPNPVDMLTTFDGVAAEYPKHLLPATAATPKGVPFVRELRQDGSKVTVSSKYQHLMECETVFDLESGGLCTSRRIVHRYKSPEKITSSTRELVQSSSGTWVPVVSTFEDRKGSDSTSPFRVGRLEISNFEPLGKRRFVGTVTPSAFGKLPAGTEILELDANGKSSFRVVDAAEIQDLESQFLKLSDKLRGKGLSGSEE